jgi:hypothetical protein
MLLLALTACAGEESSQSIPGLIAVSVKAAWNSSCTGPAGSGEIFLNAQVEPSLAVDPTDPGHLIGAWQQDRWSNGGSNGIVSAVSFDGGHTWAPKTVPFTRCSGGSYLRASDPWVSIAPDGTAYQIAYAFDGALNRAMLVSRSTDRGLTWSSPIALQHDTDPNFVMDKETVTADPLDASFAYAVWNRLTGTTIPNNSQGTGPSWFARTTNRGESWETAQQIYDPGLDAQTVSNQIVVLPDHTLVDSLMVISQNSSTNPRVNIAVIRSSDRGGSWPGPAVTVAEAEFVGVADPKSKRGIRSGNVVHGIAVDRSSGTLYLVWEDGRFSGLAHDAIALSKSTDGGLTWSAPLQVNGASAPAFTPSIAVAEGGQVGISYYDLRNDVAADSSRLMVTHWLATSSDKGTTFSETMIGVPFNLQGAPLADGQWFLGDYQGLASSGNAFLPFFVAVPSGGPATVFFRPADSVMGAAQVATLAARSVQRMWRGARERWRFGTLFK